MDEKTKRGPPDRGSAKVRTDERGRTVWAEPVAAADLELVTTQELRSILKSTDEQSVRAIEDVAKASDEGILARNSETGMFQVIGDTELRAILSRDQAATPTSSADVLEPLDSTTTAEFSLVSTQALRKMIDSSGDEAADDELDIGGGFDPYNSG